MTLITGFTCPPTIYFKFITKCDNFITYGTGITKCDSTPRLFISPVKILPENFEPSRAVFCSLSDLAISLSGYKRLNLPNSRLQVVELSKCKILAPEVQSCAESNFEIFESSNDTASLETQGQSVGSGEKVGRKF